MPMKARMHLMDHRGKHNGQADMSGKDEFLGPKEWEKGEG